MAQEPDVKPEAKAPEATQPDLEALKQKITQLSKIVRPSGRCRVSSKAMASLIERGAGM